MATSATTLAQRVRRFLRDWPEFDSLTASLTSSATTATVADATLYSVGWTIQVDSEAMRVTTAAAGTSLGIRRGIRGSTAASHANSSTVLARPNFLDIEILDALNAGLNAAFPYIHRKVIDESLTTATDDYEYAIPDMPGITDYKIPFLSEVWLQDTTDLPFRKVRAFDIKRDETAPFIQFVQAPVGDAVIRLVGHGPFPPLAATDSLNAAFPPNAEDVLVWFAGQYLLASGEAGRVRVDTGAIDNRESANRVGSSMSAANSLYSRFEKRLRDAGMPPMPNHVKATF